MNKPTHDAYNELQGAYDYFNTKLFGGELPHCLITLQRKSRRVLGYFSPQRFEKLDAARADELAMNPTHFRSRSLQDVLSTLVHEMAHVWQHHCGNPGRGAYHNKEWGTKMKAIGLYPSNTGQPGGKETGDQMMDYIIEGGPFEIALAELVKNGFQITWSEWVPAEPETPTGEGEGGEDGEQIAVPDKSNRVKYFCAGCAAKAWGKPNLMLVCGKCLLPFTR